jgi:integrase
MKVYRQRFKGKDGKKRKSTTYSYKFRWHFKNAEGETEYRTIRRSARTHNKRAAERVAERHREAVLTGAVHPDDPFPKPPAPTVKPMTLREYADEIVLPDVELHAKPRTVKFYKECLTRIEKFDRLGQTPIHLVTADLIDAYKTWRRSARRGNTPWAINAELRTLKRILRFAEEKGKIPRAPKIKMLPQPEGRTRVLSLDEEKAYLASAKVSPDLYDAAVIGLDTGLRPDSELFVTRWENITVNGIDVPSGKTKAANRTVPLSPRARAVLDFRRRSAKCSPWVFPAQSQSGHLMTLSKRHAKACLDAKVEPFPIYTWRHTYATRMAEAGVDRSYLKVWMGHSSESITAKYYIHVTSGAKQAAFDRFVEYTDKLRAEAVPLASEKAQ